MSSYPHGFSTLRGSKANGSRPPRFGESIATTRRVYDSYRTSTRGADGYSRADGNQPDPRRIDGRQGRRQDRGRGGERRPDGAPRDDRGGPRGRSEAVPRPLGRGTDDDLHPGRRRCAPRGCRGRALAALNDVAERAQRMRAMVLQAPREPLRASELPVPQATAGQVSLRVHACAVCRTDLHVVDGDLPEPKLPLVPGHQIVGTVVADGGRFPVGARVGVPWLGWTCGECRYCTSGRENLCDRARFTGYQLDGGYAEYAVADERFCFPLPEEYPDLQAAPLLCAGLIGYRSLMAAGDADRLGLYGFGDSAHIITQVAVHQGRKVFAFTRDGDEERQGFARELGAAWAGGSGESPPEELDAAIIFAPVGALVPVALRALAKGGVVVCAGIHMSDIPSFPYADLWEERSIRSVANLTRRDGEEFLALAPRVPGRGAAPAPGWPGPRSWAGTRPRGGALGGPGRCGAAGCRRSMLTTI